MSLSRNIQSGIFLLLLFIQVLARAQSPPVILAQPESQIVIAGSSPRFSVSATGTGPLRYKWYLNGTVFPATAFTFVYANVQVPDAGNFLVVITNEWGSVTSAVAVLTVRYGLTVSSNGAGNITVNPPQTNYAPNSTVTLTATPASNATFIRWTGSLASTNNPLTLTMDFNKTVTADFTGSPLVDDIIMDDSQATFTGPWITGTSAPGKYGGGYRFMDGASNSPSGMAQYRPTITTAGKYDIYLWYPQGFNRATNAPWFVSGNGGSATNYVNQQTNGGNWTLIAGAVDFAEGTNGYVQLSNAIGATNRVVIADAVKFVYAFPATIFNQPRNQTIASGQSASFSVSAFGSAPLTYQWLKNGTNILNATNSTLSFVSAQTTDSGQYSVTVSNTLGRISSEVALLTVTELRINSFSLASGNRVQFEMSFAPTNLMFEVSSDLTSWLSLTNAVHVDDHYEAVDLHPGSAQQFYRARLPD